MQKLKYLISIFILVSLVACTASKTSNNTTSGLEKKRAIYSKQLGLELAKGFNENLIKEVVDWLGTPYVYGGESKEGTDCSGFILEVYKKVYNINTPRSANAIYESCTTIKKEKLRQGQLVFFKINTEKVGHVGIFLQDNYFVHASSSKGVMVSDLEMDYWKKYFFCAGKLMD